MLLIMEGTSNLYKKEKLFCILSYNFVLTYYSSLFGSYNSPNIDVLQTVYHISPLSMAQRVVYLNCKSFSPHKSNPANVILSKRVTFVIKVVYAT